VGSGRLQRFARHALGAVRLVNGGVGLVAPRLFITQFDPDHPASPAAIYAFRLFGIRTIYLGLDLLVRPQPAAPRDVVIHASDTVTAATLALSGVVPRKTGVATTAISAVNVALAALAVPRR
jgi:hypothetical protein